MKKTATQFDTAMEAFMVALSKREVEYNNTHFPSLNPKQFYVQVGRKYNKVYYQRGVNDQRIVYCFVNRETGAILKPATWKAPEPKKYERGNIFNEDNLAGTGVYGVDYR